MVPDQSSKQDFALESDDARSQIPVIIAVSAYSPPVFTKKEHPQEN
jgi:hypothetical protein